MEDAAQHCLFKSYTRFVRTVTRFQISITIPPPVETRPHPYTSHLLHCFSDHCLGQFAFDHLIFGSLELFELLIAFLLLLVLQQVPSRRLRIALGHTETTKRSCPPVQTTPVKLRGERLHHR